MNDSNKYILDHIQTWVWSGFYSPEDVQDEIEAILDENADESMLRAAVLPEFRKKRAAELTWPVTTDCDRLDDAFIDLNSHGVIALHKTGMTMSDGKEDVRRILRSKGRTGIIGYCFYHSQDLERAVSGMGLWLAFGDLDADPAQKAKVGNQIKKTVEHYGLKVEWNNDPETRLFIPNIDWKRRSVR